MISLSLCYYVLHLLHKPVNWPRITLAGTLFMLSSFMYHGNFGVDIAYLLPVTFLSFTIRYFFSYQIWQACLLVTLCTLCQLLLSYSFSYYSTSLILYTISKIFVMIVAIVILSLIYQWCGTQGNRL